MAEPPIFFVTRKWAPATGGMETYCLRITEALSEIVPVEVIALKGRENGMPPSALSLILFPFTVMAAALRRRSAPRVLHLGDMALWPFAIVAIRWPDCRIVLASHGTDVAYQRRQGIIASFYGLYLRLGAAMLNGRARVIANSRATREVTAETGWSDIAVVPLASDFSPQPTTRAASRRVLFAGRLVRRKGCAWFIHEVLPLLPADIELDVAGTKWDAGESAALDNPRVRFLGPMAQGDLARLYAAALCVVVPNIDAGNGEYEGFGLVAPEAAAAGGVVLAADDGGLTDAVIDGETGRLLPSEDAGAWAAAILDIAGWDQSHRKAFTRRAGARARAYYNWDRVACQTIEAYALAASPSTTAVEGA